MLHLQGFQEVCDGALHHELLDSSYSSSQLYRSSFFLRDIIIMNKLIHHSFIIRYLTGCCEDRLIGFSLTATLSSGSQTYQHTDPGGPAQDLYTLIPSPRISLPVKKVRIDRGANKTTALTLCEVKVFGGEFNKVTAWNLDLWLRVSKEF